jgi:hypothetical protein
MYEQIKYWPKLDNMVCQPICRIKHVLVLTTELLKVSYLLGCEAASRDWWFAYGRLTLSSKEPSVK